MELETMVKLGTLKVTLVALALTGIVGYECVTSPTPSKSFETERTETLEFIKKTAAESNGILQYVPVDLWNDLPGIDWGDLEGTLLPEYKNCQSRRISCFKLFYNRVIQNEDPEKVPSANSDFVEVNEYVCEFKFLGVPVKTIDQTWYFNDQCKSLLESGSDLVTIDRMCTKDNSRFARNVAALEQSKTENSPLKVRLYAPVDEHIDYLNIREIKPNTVLLE